MYEIELRQLPERYAAIARFHAGAEEMGARIPAAFAEVFAFLQQRGIEVGAPAFARYHRDGDAFDVEAGFYVAQPFSDGETVRLLTLPAEEAAVTTHVGPYEGLPAAYEEIGAWTARQGRELADAMYEEYWSDPASEPPAEWRTSVVWPLRE